MVGVKKTQPPTVQNTNKPVTDTPKMLYQPVGVWSELVSIPDPEPTPARMRSGDETRSEWKSVQTLQKKNHKNFFLRVWALVHKD